MPNTDLLIHHTIVITEKILITITLLYFISNFIISLFYFQIVAGYCFITSAFYYIRALRKVESADEMALHYSNDEQEIYNENTNLEDLCIEKDLSNSVESLNYSLESNSPNIADLNYNSHVTHDKCADLHNDSEKKSTASLICNSCSVLKSEQVRHCPTCDACRVSFHHCAFLNNCVSVSNQNDFFWFLVFLIGATVASRNIWNLMIGTVVSVVLFLHLMKRVKLHFQSKTKKSNGNEHVIRYDTKCFQNKKQENSKNKTKDALTQLSTYVSIFLEIFRSETKNMKIKYVLLPWLKRDISIVD